MCEWREWAKIRVVGHFMTLNSTSRSEGDASASFEPWDVKSEMTRAKLMNRAAVIDRFLMPTVGVWCRSLRKDKDNHAVLHTQIKTPTAQVRRSECLAPGKRGHIQSCLCRRRVIQRTKPSSKASNFPSPLRDDTSAAQLSENVFYFSRPRLLCMVSLNISL